MPTLPAFNAPAPAPPTDRSKDQPTPHDNGAAGTSGDFGKTLGDVRNGAAQDNAAQSGHTQAHPAHTRNAHDTASASNDSKQKADEASDKHAPASALTPFVPGLELRPVLAAGNGKSLPAAQSTGKTQTAAHGAHNRVQSLLSQLRNTAKNPLKAGAAAGTGTDESARALQAFAKAAVQGQNGEKKDIAASSIDASRTGLTALNLQATPASAQPTAAHQLQIPSAPGSPDFTQSLSQHVAWLGSQDIQQAVIHLHPRDLGPLNVNVQVKHNQVDVSFAVQHPGTVHALQQTLPQLDTLLAQQGLSLGQAQVGQQHNPQQQASHGDGGSGGSGHADAVDDLAIEAPLPARQLAAGLVDDFA